MISKKNVHFFSRFSCVLPEGNVVLRLLIGNITIEEET